MKKITTEQQPTMALLIGSAPDAVLAKDWNLSSFTYRVAINNSWQITPDWDYLVYPEDLPSERLPSPPLKAHQQLVDASQFVPEQNKLGGFVYAGGTMAFTAAYWTLGALKPNLIAFLGCDMIYGATMGESNHFYGHGTSDPLRSDITLQSLEAKSIRFMAVANSLNCAVVNLSELPKSRLAFPRVFRKDLLADGACQRLLAQQKSVLQSAKVNQAMAAEKNLGYMASSGKYWEQLENFDAAKLSQIDDMWLQVFDVTSEAAPPTR
ncbi:MAG: hypothetical protein RL650_1698 [Pseudomonadota bacterium]